MTQPTSSSQSSRITLGARSEWIHATAQPEEHGQTVAQFVRSVMHISGRQIQRLTRSKGIRIGRKVVHLQRTLRAHDTVSVRIASRKDIASVPSESPLGVLWSDPWVLILDKPHGLSCHRTRPKDPPAVVDRLQGKPHLVHRLDAQTSGVLLIARHSYAHHRFDAVLRSGGLRKEYQAIVEGTWDREETRITNPIARDPNHPTRRMCAPHGDPSETHILHATSPQPNLSQLLVSPITGRTHQIRVHLAEHGHPIVGDRLYRSTQRAPRMMLHAHALAFIHPMTHEPVRVVSKTDLFQDPPNA